MKEFTCSEFSPNVAEIIKMKFLFICRLPLYIACFEADSVYGSHSIAVPRVLVFPYGKPLISVFSW